MEKNINIINTKENILEMDIEIKGIKSNKAKCFFVIETKEVNFSFKCDNTKNNTWTVTIPIMKQIDNTLYNFYIYMVIDGYYFEPYNGTIDVVKSNEIFVKDVSNKTFNPTTKSTKAKKTKYTEDNSIISITNRILNKGNTKSDATIIKEQKIKDILKGFKF